ncbi:MAG: phosphopantothenoylcysteine decarboxylase, partial [Methanomicrobium sp.]|nr:phosphopantothenoylcysteine decarboxylase [Methanomicrobium sp.]
REKLDDVRVLTTRSSGRMGVEAALEAYRLGADVTIVHSGNPVPLIKNITIVSSDDMRSAVFDALLNEDFDFYISAAAVSDYKPEIFDGKIPSGEDFSVKLIPLPKILDEVLKKFKGKTVAFKLDRDAGGKAEDMLKKGVFMVAANSPETMGAIEGSYILYTNTGRTEVCGDKEEVAKAIWTKLL